MKPRVSLGSVLASCLWRATLLATAWGQSDDSNSLMESALDNERRTYNGTGELRKDDPVTTSSFDCGNLELNGVQSFKRAIVRQSVQIACGHCGTDYGPTAPMPQCARVAEFTCAFCVRFPSFYRG